MKKEYLMLDQTLLSFVFPCERTAHKNNAPNRKIPAVT
jgi:hypothetical protein